jgi:ribosomal protein S18 acetylase RimI-like enzyme
MSESTLRPGSRNLERGTWNVGPETSGVEVRPAGRSEARRAADLYLHFPGVPGAFEAAPGAIAADPRNQAVAVCGDELVGSCAFIPSQGRCAVVLAPRLASWDPALAARLLRAAATMACWAGARLIQSLTDPDAASPISRTLADAGFEVLAELSYMRRPVEPAERDLPLPPQVRWRRYSRLRRRLFADTIAATYEGSLDCPGLAGLRTAADALATHKATGLFSPHAWHVAFVDGRPAGVELVNALESRTELVYLGVVPALRGRGLGRTLLVQAIRDTAALGIPKLGLAVDIRNTPAMRLYEGMGFREIRRRLAWFVPRERLAALSGKRLQE